MTTKLSVSFSPGRVAARHDLRIDISKNVDKNLIKYDKHLHYENVELAFEKVFGESLKRYNAKQSRKCRKIDNYLKHIEEKGVDKKTGKKKKNAQKPEYEYVGQIGNKDSNPLIIKGKDGKVYWGPYVELSVKIYEEYLRRFKERYPNFYVTGFDIHLDEPGGTPHFHLRYIPFATGYKQGLDRQCSLTKALENMGYERRSRDDMQISRWRHDQMDLLEEIAKEYNIERIDMDNKQERIDVNLYKQRCKELNLDGLEKVREHSVEELDRLKEGLQEVADYEQGDKDMMISIAERLKADYPEIFEELEEDYDLEYKKRQRGQNEAQKLIEMINKAQDKSYEKRPEKEKER